MDEYHGRGHSDGGALDDAHGGARSHARGGVGNRTLWLVPVFLQHVQIHNRSFWRRMRMPDAQSVHGTRKGGHRDHGRSGGEALGGAHDAARSHARSGVGNRT